VDCKNHTFSISKPLEIAMNLVLPAAIDKPHSIGRWLRYKAFHGIRHTGQDTCTRPSVQEIAKNGILEVKQALGVTIECLEGSVWVTLDGDRRDVILDAGQAFNVDRKQRTLIQALDTARVRLIEPTRAL
jgi:hypothetical protein